MCLLSDRIQSTPLGYGRLRVSELETFLLGYLKYLGYCFKNLLNFKKIEKVKRYLMFKSFFVLWDTGQLEELFPAVYKLHSGFTGHELQI